MESTPELTPSPTRSPSPTPPLVQPDHFYPPHTSDGPQSPESPSSSSSNLSPDNDPLATKGIPVFKPTMDEFRDFESYMTRVECWGMRSGIVKIIPPKEWSDALPSILPQLAGLRIKSPIEQHMLGHAGLFRAQNIVRRKSLSVREWAEMCAKEDYRAPAVDEVGLKAAGEHVPYVRRRNKRRAVAVAKEDEVSVKDELEDESHLEDMNMASAHDLPTPFPDADIGSDGEGGAEDISEPVPLSPTPATPSPRKRRFPTRADREATLAKRAELDDSFLTTFNPDTDWLPRSTSPADYTPSFCSTLERRYWRNCGLGKPPWYGADTSGTLFTPATTSWNVGSLSSALSRLLPKSSAGLPGVNSPYLYFGMWRATFAWHVEDMDLHSINYIHYGAPKFWYAVPQSRAVALENTLRSFFPRDSSACRQFLRHKAFLASPTILAQSGCKPNTLVQHAGEFVITYPRGYHAGFNLGFNCAESVNFALESWLDIGRKAQACGCVGDSVRINVDELLRAREEEALKESATTVQPPSPSSKPRSTNSISASDDTQLQTSSARKRKSNNSDSTKPNAKKQRTSSAGHHRGTVSTSASPSASKQKITLKLKLLKDPGPYPCCLCVSWDVDGLLRVHDPPGSWSGCQNVSPTNDTGWRAHERCAMVVPETWVDEESDELGGVEKMVFGVDAIVKDRWALKCALCQTTRARAHGAPIQCTKGKCLKAFHTSCARAGRLGLVQGEGEEENRVVFTELREVEKEVVVNEMPLPPPPPPAATEGNGIVLGTTPVPLPLGDLGFFVMPASNGMGMTSSQRLAPVQNVIKTVKKTEYELLCPQHNPTFAAAKRANKLSRLRSDLLALPPMSRVKLRVSGGVFEVSLLSVNEERGTVEVVWDHGIKREFKWGSVVWGKTEGQTVGQKPVVPAPEAFPDTYNSLNHLYSRPGYANPFTKTSQPSTSELNPPISTVQSTSYPSYANSGSGQLNYGPWPNLYKPPAASTSAADSTAKANVSGEGEGEVLVPGQSAHTYPYHHYSAAACQPPPMASLSWRPSTAHAQTQDEQPSSSFSQAFQETLAACVASLPPRSEFAPHPPPPPSDTPSSLTGPPPPPPSQDVGSDLPPDVMQAVEELQGLTAFDPVALRAMLASRPALVETVKMLFAVGQYLRYMR